MKSILITGASSGIGAATSDVFLDYGKQDRVCLRAAPHC